MEPNYPAFISPSVEDSQPSPPPDWLSPPPPGSDPVLRASHYLQWVRQLALQPDWIAMANPDDQHLAVLTWIGQHIHQINQPLNTILADLLSCFRPQERPAVQLFAAPIAPKVGVDGFCNLHTHPITLIVDPSRIVRADWPQLVAHELAHAVARAAGHGPQFYQALSHLCMAQDFPLPPASSAHSSVWQYWPPCRPNPQATQFWLSVGD